MDNNTPSEAALKPLPPSTDDLTLEDDLQDLALSPRISRDSERQQTSHADLASPRHSASPARAEEPEVNGYRNTLSPSASPTLPSRTPSRSPSFRNLTLTRSRSRSPSPSPSLHSGHVSEAGPSRPTSTSSHRSVTAIHSPSPRRTPSPLHSPSGHSSPHPSPQFLYTKPTIPSSTPVIVTNEDDSAEVDDSAPFESIPLQTTPPPHPATLPSSPKTLHPGSPSRKRRSWNGFAVDKPADRRLSHEAPNGHIGPADPSSRSSISTLPSSRSPSDQPQTEQASGSGSGSGSAEPATPRLHAPPAHPHPFPIPGPNSPPPSTKRTSQTHIQQNAAPSLGLGVKGTSAFEKVISHTRPSWLPPKDRVEDETHYHQWEEMMAQARKHEEEKRKVDEARRVEREKRLAINTPKWEEMLDEKTFSAERIRKDPVLRQIWFDGAPTYLRGKAWSLAIGNPLALSKDNYKACVARSKKAIESGRFPADILERLDKDLDGTLVHLKLFQKTSPLRADLHELICAWVVYRSDTAQGYAPYITYLGALFLLSSPPSTAFLSLVNLLSRPVLRAFYSETKDEIDAFYRVFENLQADMFPKIFANCKNLGLKVPESWFRSLLVEQVPFEAACRLWDQIVLDGDGYIFRAALAIFGFLEPRLHFPDRDEIESVLEGRNRATAAILEREKERAKLRGETFQDTPDGKLSVFGLNEQALFDWLKDDGWKEARFERLVIREMPD